ncbi:hypothetical protein CDAR_433271 [Caerostris darwini]|uniref:Transmembrane protein n=1 Tax=Caerostris darwini TaxID=1538125 RepID=A0AAV4QK40_9ARAC|nr:hypothetical protein CDAR_433271 [Caerostris darwini]
MSTRDVHENDGGWRGVDVEEGCSTVRKRSNLFAHPITATPSGEVLSYVISFVFRTNCVWRWNLCLCLKSNTISSKSRFFCFLAVVLDFFVVLSPSPLPQTPSCGTFFLLFNSSTSCLLGKPLG